LSDFFLRFSDGREHALPLRRDARLESHDRPALAVHLIAETILKLQRGKNSSNL
jgi:hypothetical protein